MEKDDLVLARILEHIPGSVIVTTTDGYITYINASSEARLGFEKDELAHTSIEDLIFEVEKEGSWEFIRSVILHDNKNYKGETHLVRKDKSTIVCTTNGFCVRNDNNQPEEIVLVFYDITEEKRIAEELEKKNVEMAKINSELLRSNQELKRVSEVKTKFLSIASHELKTPLTSIKGYSEIIIDNMRDKVDASIYTMVQSIDRAADRLHAVINNMLDVTRIEQKRLRLKPEDMSLTETALECIEELSQFATRRNIIFKYDFDRNIPSFYGDRMRMHQVFTNLFSNAIKYSPDNTTVEIFITIDEEERFHVIVADQGIGIDRDELEKIFDPFYEIGSTSLHSTDSTKFMGGGTGLGLSIVRGVIERHGGVIWAESEGARKGEFLGSQFHILLPVRSRIQWDDDETQIIKLNRIMETPAKVYKKMSDEVKEMVLIIDDDPEAIEITRMILQPYFTIVTADSGEEGLRIAFAQKPSLIMIDLYLPGMDGCLICRILRSQEETKDIPISFFTAATQNDEMERCYASGADDFIVKPFNGKEMLEKVTRLISIKYEKERLWEEKKQKKKIL